MSNFELLLKMVSLDDNTKKLIGASKKEIVKSLKENKNDENSSLYDMLIDKAKKEQPNKVTSVEEAAQRAYEQQSEDESKESEEDTRKDVPAQQFEYTQFKKVYDDFTKIERYLDNLIKLKNLEGISSSKKNLYPSGFRYRNDDAFDTIRNEEDSNSIINILTRIDKYKNSNDDKKKNFDLKSYSKFIKNGILIAPIPPKKLDRETRQLIQREKLEDFDVEELQNKLLDIIDTEIPTNEGNVSFLKALNDLHINRFKQTPSASKNPSYKLTYLKDIKRALKELSSVDNTLGEWEKAKIQFSKVISRLNTLKSEKDELDEKKLKLEEEIKNPKLEDKLSSEIAKLLRIIREVQFEKPISRDDYKNEKTYERALNQRRKRLKEEQDKLKDINAKFKNIDRFKGRADLIREITEEYSEELKTIKEKIKPLVDMLETIEDKLISGDELNEFNTLMNRNTKIIQEDKEQLNTRLNILLEQRDELESQAETSNSKKERLNRYNQEIDELNNKINDTMDDTDKLDEARKELLDTMKLISNLDLDFVLEVLSEMNDREKMESMFDDIQMMIFSSLFTNTNIGFVDERENIDFNDKYFKELTNIKVGDYEELVKRLSKIMRNTTQFKDNLVKIREMFNGSEIEKIAQKQNTESDEEVLDKLEYR